jgi:hypothetical protein
LGPREDMILDRWVVGETSTVIARALGVSPSYILSTVQRARLRGDKRAETRAGKYQLSRQTPKDVRDLMRAEATRRGMPHNDLIELLFAVICRDNLFKALLDD